RLDSDGDQSGADDDASTGLFLWGDGAPEEYSFDPEPELYHDGRDEHPMGADRLYAGVWKQSGRIVRELRVLRLAECGGSAERSLCRDHSTSGVFGLPDDVCHHYTRADYRGICRAGEVQDVSGVRFAVGDTGL